MRKTPPDEVFVVKVRGEWPLYVYEGASHAISTYERLVREKGHDRVHIWLCRMEAVEELQLVRATAFLAPKETP